MQNYGGEINAWVFLLEFIIKSNVSDNFSTTNRGRSLVPLLICMPGKEWVVRDRFGH
jgi:hypothetical protein